MTIKINGKPFDFDAPELYEGEPTKSKTELLFNLCLFAAIMLLAYACYPLMVKALQLFFQPLLSYFGW